jgi:glycerophosphoryl diester phosphodiesterase
MIILSHRGYWKSDSEKNTIPAFIRSFENGYGTETDIRDSNGILVISHDMPDGTEITVESFFEIYKQYTSEPTLALNIKADGMQAELDRLLRKFEINNYFVFDMAVPDGLLYCRKKLKTFTRQSEYEMIPSYYQLANGIWLDEFDSHWITDEIINHHLDSGKEVCIVSPDLHRRDYHQEWAHYKNLETIIGKDRLMLCTDFPDRAQEFFNA